MPVDAQMWAQPMQEPSTLRSNVCDGRNIGQASPALNSYLHDLLLVASEPSTKQQEARLAGPPYTGFGFKPIKGPTLYGAKLPLVPMPEIRSMRLPKGWLEDVAPLSAIPGQCEHEFHPPGDKDTRLRFYCTGMNIIAEGARQLADTLQMKPHELTEEEMKLITANNSQSIVPYQLRHSIARTGLWNGKIVIEADGILKNDDRYYGISYDGRDFHKDPVIEMEIVFIASPRKFQQHQAEVKQCLKSINWDLTFPKQ